jgi:hypothetical protein
MASPNSTFTEMVTTTLRNHAREVVDNISDNNALLRYLKKKGHIKTESGGYEIVLPLEYDENDTYSRYSGYDVLNTNASDVLSAAKYDWCQAAIHVTASGRELRMNNGEAAMIKLVKTRIKNAMHTASNQLAIDLYSDGTASNQIAGLGNLIQSSGTGTVGGIVSSTYTFWKNQFSEMAGTGTWSKSTIKGEMNKLWYPCVRGTDKPDLIVASQDIYAAYEEALQDNQRYMKADEASAGFETLKYKTADVIFDDNSNFSTTAEVAYFVNTDYLYLIQHSEAQWSQDEERKPTNQDAIVVPLYWMGALVTSNRSLQGKLYDAA